ncbi:dihydroxyacetone kinase, phosphotransfer subunit [Actinomyces johnsonii F0542]|uniref:phosphoenolpyruvate--glycerone phosphotransferase n=1 Tax=Actinomyces johnsonii F0542 TaxID=1321818 RepID=U1QKG9_9ACTO|nr:dihydroxyacetone kinase phosphoryl donor subunit DhaM [Actinomyces johnsonii]ERH22661.1 dihydroxyacetone kinase, phosphotransfer subunit [Actinomyces johnsonii F0542]
MPVNPAKPAGPATTSGTAQSSGAPVSVGIVLVSHSRSLAESALDLARRLIVAVDVPVELAAGLADGALGTDPGLIVSVVEQLAARCAGVLVLADLGSGIMSAEMALEMLDPAVAERVRLSAAPFVEGLLGAYGAAGIGKDLGAVVAEADGAAEAKRSQVAAL